jgi:hypothetical protein
MTRRGASGARRGLRFLQPPPPCLHHPQLPGPVPAPQLQHPVSALRVPAVCTVHPCSSWAIRLLLGYQAAVRDHSKGLQSIAAARISAVLVCGQALVHLCILNLPLPHHLHFRLPAALVPVPDMSTP